MNPGRTSSPELSLGEVASNVGFALSAPAGAAPAAASASVAQVTAVAVISRRRVLVPSAPGAIVDMMSFTDLRRAG
jgi:hypothetical protein